MKLTFNLRPHVWPSSPSHGHKVSLTVKPGSVSSAVTRCVSADWCSLFCLLSQYKSRYTGDGRLSYPVHSEEDAWPSLRIAIVGVLHPRTVPQPGPLKLTRFPLCALLQVVLHEVSVLCAVDVLPLLSAIVICWRWRSGRESESERGGHK